MYLNAAAARDRALLSADALAVSPRCRAGAASGEAVGEGPGVCAVPGGHAAAAASAAAVTLVAAAC